MTIDKSPTLDSYNQIFKLRNKWVEVSETLPEASGRDCNDKVNQMAGLMIGRIREYYFLQGVENLPSQTLEWTQKFDLLASKVCRDNEVYLKGREEIRDQLNQIDKNMQEFREKQRKEISRDHEVTVMEKPSKSFLSFGLDLAEGKEKKRPGFIVSPFEAIEVIQTEENMRRFETSFGRRQTTKIESLSEVTTAAGDYFERALDSPDRIRNAALSGVAYGSLFQGLSMAMQRTAAGLVMTGVGVLAEVGSELESKVDRSFEKSTPLYKTLQHCYPDPEGFGCATPEEIALALKVALRTLQIPDRLLKKTHDALTETLVSACDELGLKSENLIEVYKTMNELIASNSEAPI